MGTQERREREKLERKASILRCAKALLLERGLEEVNMADIAERAELSKGTLYIYFPGKEELLKEICADAERKFIDHFQSQLSTGLSALELIKLYWLCYIETFGTSEDMIVIFNMKRYIAPSFPINPFEQQNPDSDYFFYTSIRDMINQGIQEGVFDRSINASMVARTMLSIFSYVVENIAKMPKERQRSRLIIDEAKHIFEILLRGIACEGFDRSALNLPGLAS